MDPKSFERLLLTTAFCCMASDSKIDEKEIAVIQSMCEKSPLFEKLNFKAEINNLVLEINSKGKSFISDYFASLKESSLSEQEELTLIDLAIKTIQADEIIEYSEIKFFKVIRNSLKISDDNILSVYPGIEKFLEKDIITESYLEKITNQYLEVAELPQFELLLSDIH
jgi:uncharacterized tellurite resistance protein B-like protein